ncbi:LuxR C-terminal-related transcriptional regulator [Amycolatopsis aidingensis]|uniref:LuxR C-terminal-related transcriptional regulator n=1 Tax=Amycolatopsis aidingensis TaxID=2842453 RepID=UPI001C0AAB16|nr:LuxR C-terminal-related transcriptional regulator [Amycolatopsis aidingensis]
MTDENLDPTPAPELPGGNGVFRAFFDRTGIRAANLDDQLRVVEASVDFGKEFGVSVPSLRGEPLPDLLHPSVRGSVAQQFSWLAEGQRPRFVERVLAMRSGNSVFGGELTGFAVYGPAGQVDSLMALLRPEQGDRGNHVVVGRKKLLTELDARILEGVAAGASTVQLAALVYLSCGGVEYHLTALLRMMKVRNRSALVAKAFSMGLFGVGGWPPRVLPEYVH